jgi:hypothetical protein
MAPHLPDAAIHTQVRVPLRFPDGYATTALVTSFRGLVDSREHLAFACGSPTAVPLVRPHSECLTGDVFGTNAATAAHSCGRRLSGSRWPVATCSTWARRDAASVSPTSFIDKTLGELLSRPA